MDAKVTGSIVTHQSLGNLPAEDVTFYTEKKPTIAVAETKRVAYLGFKTNKEKGTKRENMAVVVDKWDADDFVSKSRHDFLNDLIAESQDKWTLACANGEISWADSLDADKMIADFNDNSRTGSGRKVTKEIIGAWFDKTVANTVELRAKTKNAQMTVETVAKVQAGFREMFGKFTGYNLVNLFTDAQQDLIRVLMISTTFEEGDEIAEYILTKLDKIAQDKKAQDSLMDQI